MTEEKKIQTEILKEFGARTDMRVWRANCGVARAIDSERIIKFGINGQADVSGVYRDGRRIEIEVKTPDGRLSKEQKNWAAMCIKFNAIYVAARSVEDVYAGFSAAGIELRATAGSVQ